ncbi:MAG: hypothetical protein Q7N50_10080 [Armatimonadota bacterium]|nr:hypothetical protein [Armatimonadota bacterium]
MFLQLSPDWFHAIRLLVTFIVTTALGAHAFYRFKTPGNAGAPKSWAFLLYSLAFLMSSTLNFLSLLITIGTRTYARMPTMRLGTFTIVLIITYMALAMTTRRQSTGDLKF